MRKRDTEALLSLDGVVIEQAGGHWTRFEVREVIEGVAYVFIDAHQLLKDFWLAVDKILYALGLEQEN